MELRSHAPEALKRMILPPTLHLAAAALAAALAGCSHTAPYYRADVAAGAAGRALPAEDLAFRVILIGDAGAPGPGEPVLATLKAWARRDPDRTLVAFLGDNVYEDGFTGADRRDEERRLERQLETLEGPPGPRGLFIPGNHDWAGGSEAGLAALKAQQEYVERRLSPGSFLPRDGRPGPVKIDLPDSAGAVLRLVAVDSQWWLHEGRKPDADRDRIVAGLVRCLTTDLPVVVLAHHPLESAGNHGGFFDWRDFLFPVTRATDAPWAWLIPAPLLYPLGRRFTPLGTGQDIFAPAYREMKEDLRRASRARDADGRLLKPLAWAAGHDHNLQVMEGGEFADYLLISGAGSAVKMRPVGDRPRTLFAHEHPGFILLDVLADGSVWLRVVEPAFDEAGQQLDPGSEPVTFTLRLRAGDQ